MRKYYLISIVLLLTSQVLFAAKFMHGQDINITGTFNRDLYAAGGTVHVNAKINGDMVVAGGNVSISDTIYHDLIVAGGTVNINGPVGDDLRALGGDIKVNRNVKGDVIVLGGNVIIGENVTIGGDLVMLGGTLVNDGNIKGDLVAKGGNIVLNGIVDQNMDVRCNELHINSVIKGTSTLAANKITLGNETKFHNNVSYWQKSGMIQFDGFLTGGTASYDPSLAIPQTNYSWRAFGTGAFILGMMYLVSILLVMLALIYLFPKFMDKSGTTLDRPLKSFAYGIIYFIGLPLLIAFLFVTVVGIPIALFALFVYAFSVGVGQILAAVVISNWYNHKYNKSWKKGMLLLASLVVFIAFKLIALIPFLGFLAIMLVVSAAVGTVIMNLLGRKKNIIVQ